jgi:hypothetical protein
MNQRNMRDMFKVRIEYEGQIITKEKAKGVKGLKSIFKNLELKLK